MLINVSHSKTTLTDIRTSLQQVAPLSTAVCPIGRRILGPQIGSSDVLITQFADEQSPVDSEADYDTDMENEGVYL